MDRAPIVDLTGVTKRFGSHTVVDHLSLSVPPGQIYGLIGPSGCGKTTTIRLMLGVLAPDSGTVRVLGIAPEAFTTKHREQIGYTPQRFFLYPTLTVAENARFVAGLYGLGWFRRRRRVREVLHFLELWQARNRLARDISGGMQRRLELGCALLHEPALLIVDEPTAGLDPVLRAKIWDHLRELRGRGVTVLVSTQYIEEAVHCDSLAILNHGAVAAAGTPDELRRRVMGGQVLIVQADRLTRDHVIALWELPVVQAVDREDAGTLRITVTDTATATPVITRALAERGASVVAVWHDMLTFDEVFMKIVAEDDGKPEQDPELLQHVAR